MELRTVQSLILALVFAVASAATIPLHAADTSKGRSATSSSKTGKSTSRPPRAPRAPKTKAPKSTVKAPKPKKERPAVQAFSNGTRSDRYARCDRDEHGRIQRKKAAKSAFMKSTGYPIGQTRVRNRSHQTPCVWRRGRPVEYAMADGRGGEGKGQGRARIVPVNVLQRDWYFVGPRKQVDFFVLKKGTRSAVCELWSHQFGWELRLIGAGEMIQTQVCRSQDEVLSTGDQWKAAMVEKGWSAER